MHKFLHSILFCCLLLLGVGELWGQCATTGVPVLTVTDTATAATGGPNTFSTTAPFVLNTTVPAAITTTTQAQITICKQGHFILNLSNITNATNFNWSTTAGTFATANTAGSSNTLELLSSNSSLSFTITVIVTCPGGTMNLSILVNSSMESPSLALSSPPATGCNGDPITLTANACTGGVGASNPCFPTLTYYFAGSPGALAQTGPSTTFNTPALSTGSYAFTVTAKNGNKCYARLAPHNVTVNPKPNISAITASNRCKDLVASTSGGTCTGCTGGAVFAWTIVRNPSTVVESSALTTPSWIVPLSTTGAHTANLSVTDLGCTSSLSSSFTVNPLPSFQATANGSTSDRTGGNGICLGASATLNYSPTVAVAGPFVAVWSAAPGTAGIVHTNPNNPAATTQPTANATYNYTLQITDVNSCVASDDIRIEVKDTMEFIATTYLGPSGSTPVPNVCVGESVRIELTENDPDFSFPGANNITWSSISGPNPIPVPSRSNGDQTAAIGPFNNPGTYVYQIVVDPAGTTCNSVKRVSVIVNANPVVNITSTTTQTVAVCSGTNVTLNGTIVGGTYFQWQQNGVPIATATGPTLTTTYVNSTASNVTVTYTLVGQSGTCKTSTNYNVIYKPRVSIDITDQTTPHCSNTALPVSYSKGTGTYTFLWHDGSTGSNFTIPPQSAGASYTVSVTVTSNGCTATDTEIYNFVDCGAFVITSSAASNNHKICEGDTLRLKISNPAFSGSNYIVNQYWSTGNYGDSINVPITASTPSSFTVEVYTYVYSLVCGFSGCGGCCYYYYSYVTDNFSTYTVTVVRPNVDLIPTDSVEYCYGQTVSLNPSCTNCSGTASYLWHDGVSSSTPRNISFTQDTTISFTATDFTCSASAIRNYKVKPQIGPVILEGDTARLCRGDFITLNSTSSICNGCTRLWSTGQGGTSISTNQPGKYFLNVTNNGCTETDSIVVMYHPYNKPIIEDTFGVAITGTNFVLCANPEIIRVQSSSCPSCNLTWNTGATTPFITVSNPGGFFVTGIDTNGCRAVSNPILVTRSTIGQGSIATANPQARCNNQPFTLDVTPCVGCSYSWINNATGLSVATTRTHTTTITGSYYANVTNSDGCVYPSNIVTVSSLTVGKPPISTNTDSLCSGNGALATLRTSSNPSYIGYQWYGNNTIISGATDSTYSTNQTGSYFVRVTYANGCKIDSDSIIINPATFTPIASATNSVVCQGSTVTVSTALYPGWIYQWYRNGNVISGATQSSYLVTQSGQYYAIVRTSFGCTAQTNILTLGATTLGNIDAVTNKTQICPGDSATLSVTLCAGCNYQWFNAVTGGPLTASNSGNYTYLVGNSGQFYAQATNGTCFVNSDTIQIQALPVITPAINTSSSFVCEGRNATLQTSGCSGCIYTWLRNGSPIFGALNDTFFIVSNPADAGNYRVLVSYSNGCSDTSAVMAILDGSYTVAIKVDSAAGSALACNGSNVVLQIDSVNSSPLSYCSLGCNFQWFKNSVPLVPSNTARYNTTTGGYYKLKMTDSRGCIEESNLLQVNEVNLTPNITSTSTAICGDMAVLLNYPNNTSCTGCTYQWKKGGSNIAGATNFSHVTDTGSAGVGVYFLEVTQLGCVALSNLIPLNQIAGLSIPVASTDPNICAGDTVTVYRVGGNCTNCQFQWLRDSIPVLSATTPSLIVSQPGRYMLQMTTTNNGCRDTSIAIQLDTIAAPAGFGFNLAANGLTPLTTTGPTVNLYGAVTPPSIWGSTRDTFYSQPFNAAMAPNSGLSGPGNQNFNPGTAGVGYHRIYYRYDTLGCRFTLSDIMQILNEPRVDIFNENGAAPSFEACVADTLRLVVSNLTFKADSVYLYNDANQYVSVPIASNGLSFTVYGLDTVWNGTIRLGIPDWAFASFMMLTSANGLDTFMTPFLLVRNEILSFSGLPGVVCSNSGAIPLTGTPTGGYFTAEYHTSTTLPMGTNVAGAFTANNFNTGSMTRASYGADQIENIRVVYNFVNRYTNNIACPQVDTVSKIVEARAVFIDSVKYNPIAISQDRELLKNLVFRVYPYTAQPSQWAAVGNISFNGNFSFPAGNPVQFLPSNAGVGRHAMTYNIHNGVCMNSRTDSIQVVPRPLPIGIPDSMCKNQTFPDFGRELGFYTYFDGPSIPVEPGVTIQDTINILKVRTTAGTSLTVVNPAINLERYNYSPATVVGNYDTLYVEYWYRKVERIGTAQIDTVEYIVGSIVKPIFIDTPYTVRIDTNIVQRIYCEENRLYLLAGTPFGGNFSLVGGTGIYTSGAPLANNVLNPYEVHNSEATNTIYNLIYTKNGAVCRNSDSMRVTIPKPLNASFYTASGKRVYCATDPRDSIMVNTTGTYTSDFLINGVAQINPNNSTRYTFNPSVLFAGNHQVQHLVRDTFNCTYRAIDTFVINPLPVLSINPRLDLEYCTNDPIDSFITSPKPYCAPFSGTGPVEVSEGFDGAAFPPTGWVAANIGSGSIWQRDAVQFFAGAASAKVARSNFVENTWLFSPYINMVNGNTYRVQFRVKTGALGTCATPPCSNAALSIRVGTAQTVANHSGPSGVNIGNYPNLADTLWSQMYADFVHVGGSTPHSISFQCFSGSQNSRELWIDNIEIINMTQNGCNIGAGRVTGPGITNVLDSLYTFNPTVVAPGVYNVKYIYTAAITGCTDSVVMPIKVKPHPIISFNNLDTQYCDNAPPVPLIGNPNGGTFASTGPNLLQGPPRYNPRNPISSEIVSYTYTSPATMCTTIFRDTVRVVAIPDSARISSISTAGYCYNAGPKVLNVATVFGTPSPGIFYGTGVRNGAGGPGVATFHPDSAVIESGRHGDFTITYVYRTRNGCMDTTRITTKVHAMPRLTLRSYALSDTAFTTPMPFPDSICLNAQTLRIRANNYFIRGNMGQIQFDSLTGVGPSWGTYVPSLGQQDTLVPRNFGVGWHNISYTYSNENGCTSTIRDSFRVDTIPVIYFTGLQPDRIYCENDAPSLVLGYPPYYPGSGYLSIASFPDTITVDSSFYMINPAVLVDTSLTTKYYHVYYTYTNLNGCRGEGFDTFQVRPYPRINLAIPPSFCVSEDSVNLMQYVTPRGGIFTDNLVVTSIVRDSLLDLTTNAGQSIITYYYVDSATTCFNKALDTINVYNTPDIDYAILGGCQGAVINFVPDSLSSNLIAGIDSVTMVQWSFGDGVVRTIFPPTATSVPADTHQYAGSGHFMVTLYVTNRGGCTDSISQDLVVSPLIVGLNATPYVEDFQTGTNGWYQEQAIQVPDSVAIWQRAELLGINIDHPGNFAFVTMPNAPYTYLQGQRAWVYSPCFDFSYSRRPMMVLDIWRDFSTDIDGSVVEYYNNHNNTWTRLGDKDRGIHWYQTNFLVARPGNQANAVYPTGWTGQSNGWEKARYRLDHLAGNNHVRFRVAFASDPNTVLEGREGMAFDSVWIGERGRNVLVEHYSNVNYVSPQAVGMDVIDQMVYDTIFNNINGRDVSLIEYHTDLGGEDPINNQNYIDADARVLHYGVTQNNQMKIDGLPRGSGKSEDISQYELDYDMLQFPVFDIQIPTLNFIGNTIQVDARVTALVNLDSSKYVVQIAVIEDSIRNVRGFHNMSVMRKLLPDNGGTLFRQPWTAGQVANVSQNWAYPSGMINPNNVEVLVFIQDENTDDILQVQTTRDLSIFSPVGTQNPQVLEEAMADMKFKLYPNPANQFFNVEFAEDLNNDYNWRLIDALGRVIQQGQLFKGTQSVQVKTEGLSEGVYFFTLQNGKVYSQRQVAIVKRP